VVRTFSPGWRPGVLPRVKGALLSGSQAVGKRGANAPRRAEPHEAEDHHRPSGSLGYPGGNDKGRARILIVVSPKSVKPVGAKIRGEAGVCIDAVILTEIDGAILALNSVKSDTVDFL
jgi:hypothetical protein